MTGPGNGEPERGFAFLRTPAPNRLWVGTSVAAAIVLPVALAPMGDDLRDRLEVVSGLVLVLLSILNVEIGRLLEGGVADSQRPHKALSAWSFASALLLPTWWLLPVVAISYGHARWRGLRVPLWKWVGSAAYVVLAGLAAGLTARAVLGSESNLMHGDGLTGLIAVVGAAIAFLAVETVLFHGSAYLNVPEDEGWLRDTLRSRSFYVTEVCVLLIGGLSAAVWTGGSWFLVLMFPVYALTQRAALHVPLRERAEHNDKTGLLRFESWRRLAVAGSERCARRSQPWSVVFVDLDRFKLFNDQWGHLAGDRVLVAVARSLESQLRDCDVVGRFGGEEFCVFLPGIGLDDARRVGERIRSAVDTMDTETAHQVTISVGVASVDPSHEQVEFVQALTTADNALYDAKHAGRNATRLRVVGFTPRLEGVG